MKNSSTILLPQAGNLKAEVDSAIVTQTLDKLNGFPRGKGKKKSLSSGQDSMSQTYDFAKGVLSAAFEAKGITVGLKS
ncbi:MAG: hypothetical protein LBO77_08595 [Desulfovibrio sp.]|jgi:hypothetical protein|nr:hypothetical protein [Desulfovibrio sp.]